MYIVIGKGVSGIGAMASMFGPERIFGRFDTKEEAEKWLSKHKDLHKGNLRHFSARVEIEKEVK